MKTLDGIVIDLKAVRGLLNEAIAIQQLVGTEGYRLLMSGVAERIREHAQRLMQMECGHDETNQLRAKIASLNWFLKWSPDKASRIPDLVKRMEGLQKLAANRHDANSEAKRAEIDQLVAAVADLKTEVLSHE
jgi:uncharacterized coiled-coil DUF342 family protein